MSAEAGEWAPAFEGQRPPFAKGNTLAEIVHGAYSPRKVEPLATELVTGVLADPDTAYLSAARWRPALWAWARAEAQVQLVSEYLAGEAQKAGNGVGDLEAEHVRAAYLLLHRAEARATTGRTRLGLDPLSASKLGRNKAAAQFDAARAMAELDRQAQELARQDASDDEGAGDDDE